MHDDMFAPESVDEQVDRLLSGSADETSQPRAEALVRQLRALYDEDQDSAGRVWARLAEQVTEREEFVRQREVLDALAANESSPQLEIQVLRAPALRVPARAIEVTTTLLTAILIASLLLTFHLISSGRASPTPTTQVQGTPPGIYVNEGDGVARLSRESRRVIWHVKMSDSCLLDDGAASPPLPPPVVADNTVFVSCDGHLLALNATTGAQRWSHVYSGADLGDDPPYLDGNVLYVPNPTYNGSGTVSGTLFALNPLTGAITARYTGAEATGQVSDSVLYYQTENFIYARQLPGNTPLWQWQVQPSIVHFAGAFNGVLYVETSPVPSSIYTMYGLDLHNGTQLWKGQGEIGAPVFSDGIMYVCSADFSARGQLGLYAFD